MINDWLAGKLNEMVCALNPSATRLPGCFQPPQQTSDPKSVCLCTTCHRAADDALSHVRFLSFLQSLQKALRVLKILNFRYHQTSRSRKLRRQERSGAAETLRLAVSGATLSNPPEMNPKAEPYLRHLKQASSYSLTSQQLQQHHFIKTLSPKAASESKNNALGNADSV